MVSGTDGGPTTSRRQALKAGAALLGTIALAGSFHLVPQSGPRGGADSGSGGGFTPRQAPRRFYTDGPPARNGETIRATDYGSLQEAHDALEPGDTLFIPQAGGPFRERFRLSGEHITIASDGATIEQPDNNQNYAIASDDPLYRQGASLVGQHIDQNGRIRVDDTSPFSPGDDIHVSEFARPYGRAAAGGTDGASKTIEFRTVTGVGDGTLSLNYPLRLPYPNTSRTVVGVMDWTGEDIRITGLRIEGTKNETGSGRSSRPVQLNGIKHAWLDNLTITGGGNYSLGLGACYRCRTENITFRDGLRYGLDVDNGSTTTMHTNIRGNGLGRYVVRFGAGGGRQSTTDGFVHSVHGSGMGGQFVANAHNGSYGTRWENIVAEGERVFRMRARDIVVDGFESVGSTSYDFRTRQLPTNITIRNGSIREKQSDDVVFSFDLRGSGENERGENLTFEGIDIEPYAGNWITDIGEFDGRAIIDGLTFREVTYGRERLTREHVEQWDGYGSADISNLVVE